MIIVLASGVCAPDWSRAEGKDFMDQPSGVMAAQSIDSNRRDPVGCIFIGIEDHPRLDSCFIKWNGLCQGKVVLLFSPSIKMAEVQQKRKLKGRHIRALGFILPKGAQPGTLILDENSSILLDSAAIEDSLQNRPLTSPVKKAQREQLRSWLSDMADVPDGSSIPMLNSARGFDARDTCIVNELEKLTLGRHLTFFINLGPIEATLKDGRFIFQAIGGKYLIGGRSYRKGFLKCKEGKIEYISFLWICPDDSANCIHYSKGLENTYSLIKTTTHEKASSLLLEHSLRTSPFVLPLAKQGLGRSRYISIRSDLKKLFA